MPSWAAALTHLTAGFKHMEGMNSARPRGVSPIQEHEPDDKVLGVQSPTAGRQTRPRVRQRLGLTLEKFAKLKQDGKPDEAMELLKSAAAENKNHFVQSVARTDEVQLQKVVDENHQQQEQQKQQDEAVRHEREQRDQQQAAEEAKLLQSVDTATGPLWHAYDFQGCSGEYDAVAAQIETIAGRRLLEPEGAWWQTCWRSSRPSSPPILLAGHTTARIANPQFRQTLGAVNQGDGHATHLLDTLWRTGQPMGRFCANNLQKLAENYATAFSQTDKPENIARGI